MIDIKTTYEHVEPRSKENRHKKIWVSQPGSGLEKRQCTLQICFHPEGEQPKIGIIFRGMGKRISEAVKLLWHPDVDVFFQLNAWADTKFCLGWVEKTLKSVVKEHFVLFLDNLNCQTSDEFKEAVANLNGVCWYGVCWYGVCWYGVCWYGVCWYGVCWYGVCWYGVPGVTDIWQPVDAGYAELLKVKIRQEHYNWLDSDKHRQMVWP